MELYINEKISYKKILEFLKAQFTDAGTNVHAFQLHKDNELMVRLAPTPYSNTHKKQVYSVSKTFAATAIGIACDIGILKVTDKLTDIFKNELPEKPSEYISELTVQHLLTMSAGHNGCSMKDISLSDNGVKAFFERTFANKPGEKYLYDSGASYMLSAIITKLTGLSMLDFLYIHLFRYMNIENSAWPFCGGSINEGGIGIRASADDIAKLGLLYLNKGIFNGRRLLSERWIEEAVSGYLAGDLSREPDWKSGYGYQIWRNAYGGYRADGAFGQYCIVIPEKNIVMVLLVESENVEKELSLCFDYIDSFFEKAVEDISLNELEAFLSSCYKPYKSEALSALGKNLYKLDDNLNKLTLAFTENAGDEFVFTLSDGERLQTITAGNGKWIENNLELKGFKPQLYSLMNEKRRESCRFFASFKAEKAHTDIELKYIDCPHTAVLKISEEDNLLSVDLIGRADTMPDTLFKLRGTKIS